MITKNFVMCTIILLYIILNLIIFQLDHVSRDGSTSTSKWN